MKQQKNLRNFPTALCVCALLTVLHGVDLLLFTRSGGLAGGSVWLRIVPGTLGAAALWGLSCRLPAETAPLQKHHPRLGAAMAVTGAALIACGGWALPHGQKVGALALVSGAVLLVQALRERRGGERTAASVWPVLAGLLFFGALLVDRFALRPAAVVRVSHTLLVVSAVAALVFAVQLGKVVCLPDAPGARNSFFSGMLCFLFCTCGELPQAMWFWLHGEAAAFTCLWAVPLALLGLCGLMTAALADGDPAKNSN